MSFLSSITSAVRSVAQTVTSAATQLAKQPAPAVAKAPTGHSVKSTFTPAPVSAKPASPTQKVSFLDPAGKKSLIEGSSQVNAVSQRQGNSNSICGGAAIVNGLILSSKTADSLGVPPNREEAAALKAMESGKMSPTDVAHLQQLGYKIAKYADPMMTSDLVNPGEMAFATTMLRANGAFAQEPNVTFHEAQSTAAGGNHWTVSVGNQHADSMATSTGGASLATPTPSSVVMDGSNPGWRGDVQVNNGSPPKVSLAYPVPGTNGTRANFVEIEDPAQFKMESFTDLAKATALANRIKNGQVIRVGTTTVDRRPGTIPG